MSDMVTANEPVQPLWSSSINLLIVRYSLFTVGRHSVQLHFLSVVQFILLHNDSLCSVLYIFFLIVYIFIWFTLII